MFCFSEELHQYTLGKEIIPSVTQIINSAGLHPFDFIHPDKLRELADRGRIVHKITELYDSGLLDESTVDPKLTGFLDAWKKFRAEFKFEVTASEKMMLYEQLKYAGTCDRTIYRDGKTMILDIKTGQYHPSYEAQIAAYTKMAGLDADIGYCVTILEDGNYKLTKCDVTRGWTLFLSCLNICKFKKKHNIGV